MPNWVKNRVEFNCSEEKLNELKNFMKSDKSCFDFNNLIPVPEELNLDAGSTERCSLGFASVREKYGAEWKTSKEYLELKEAYKHFNEHTPDGWADIGDAYLSNIRKYGYSSWYEWCLAKWGTKWNACNPSWDEDVLMFDTAWSCPEPIFKALSERFPDIEFYAEFADEDIGSNCGIVEYTDGNFRVEYVDSVELACDLWGYDPSEFLEDEVIE